MKEDSTMAVGFVVWSVLLAVFCWMIWYGV
jgi:hypothetical protein